MSYSEWQAETIAKAIEADRHRALASAKRPYMIVSYIDDRRDEFVMDDLDELATAVKKLSMVDMFTICVFRYDGGNRIGAVSRPLIRSVMTTRR